MILAEYQFTDFQHRVGDNAFQVIRAFQRQRQTAARRTGAPGIGDKAAVQVQAIVGGKGNAAAVAGDLCATLPRHIEQRLAAGCIEPRAFAQHHKQITGFGNAGGQINIAANRDLAAIAHLAIHLATIVDSGHGP